MTRRVLALRLLIFVLLASWCTAAFAEFPKLRSKGQTKTPVTETPSDTPAGSPSEDISSEGLVQAYMAAQRDLTEARIHLANAFDLKEHVLALELEREALGSSSTLSKKEIDRQQATSASADEAIGRSIEQEQLLTEEGKQHYRASLEPYGRGLIKAAKLPIAAERFLQQTKSAATGRSLKSKMGLGTSGKAAVFVAKSIPPFVRLARKTFGQVRSYSEKLQIEIPADATDVLASLDEVDFATLDEAVADEQRPQESKAKGLR